ncbi:hypothetical protein, partial [Erwinia amylovora]|uniref:hypothetical protein n=1 Tax=Erwinia amylovora TaxID=552 RepID=UPI0020BDF280
RTLTPAHLDVINAIVADQMKNANARANKLETEVARLSILLKSQVAYSNGNAAFQKYRDEHCAELTATQAALAEAKAEVARQAEKLSYVHRM